jgi:TRAP-type C4-dicarboxylate transport system substrate-binding protein
MTAEDRDHVRRIARESVQVARAMWDERERSARSAALEAGVTEVDVDLAAFRAAAAPMLESYRTDPRIDALWRAIRALA